MAGFRGSPRRPGDHFPIFSDRHRLEFAEQFGPDSGQLFPELQRRVAIGSDAGRHNEIETCAAWPMGELADQLNKLVALQTGVAGQQLLRLI